MKKIFLLILACTVLIILYFITVKLASKPKNTVKPSTTVNTLNNVKITKISNNTIWVEQMAANTTSTPTAIKVTTDTIISRTKNTNFFLPETKTSEKLTFADLKIGYLATIKTTSDTIIPPEITATSIDIFDVSNTLTGRVVSISDKTMKLKVIFPNIEITDKNGSSKFQTKDYTVKITSNTRLNSFNNGKEAPIKLSDIKADDNVILLANQKTDVSKTNSIDAVKIVIIKTPPIITTPKAGQSTTLSPTLISPLISPSPIPTR